MGNCASKRPHQPQAPGNKMSTSTIVQLSQLISQSVQTIERTCAANGTTVPDLDALFNPQSEAFRFDPAIGEAVNTATAAAYQLAAILEPPPVSVSHIAAGVSLYFSTSCKVFRTLKESHSITNPPR